VEVSLSKFKIALKLSLKSYLYTMSSSIKSPESILAKLGIKELNPMQEQAGKFIRAGRDIVLLSPTGTGKTLAFLLPALEQIDPDNPEIQVLILVPSRELAPAN
jgi:superfamily II DNA/RNA helicase